MPEVLKISHLADRYQMTDMHVIAGGIDAKFDPQRRASLLAFIQFGDQVFQRDDFVHGPLDHL